MIQLIKSAEGFRIGNFVFVDEFVFPPNFIVASPKILVEGFEAILNKEKTILRVLMQKIYGWIFSYRQSTTIIGI